MFCTLTSRFWIWLGSAISVGGSPGLAAIGLASGAPPVSAIAEAPVKPCISSRALVSARTGMRLSTSISAATRPGSSAQEIDRLDFADAQAVEQHDAAARQSRHRALEHDAVAREVEPPP